MLELHIWGPSFTLPSLSPQCLSAIAYLNLTLQRSAWALIASSNPLLSPNRELPALRDGTTWACGFKSIAEYLRQKMHVELDDGLDVLEKSEALAFGTYIETQGGILLDLSLYLTDENFDVLRSAYAKLLPIPARYYIPSTLRQEARARCSGLPLPQHSPSPPPPPSSLPLPQPPKLSAASAAQAIKRASLAQDFLSTLQDRLGANKYFFGDTPRTLDCLAVGYLSLAFFPELPDAWARQEMAGEYKRLCGYLNDVRGELLGGEVDAVAVMAGQPTQESELPWGVVERGDAVWVTGFMIDKAMQIVGLRGRKLEGREGEEEAAEERKRKRKMVRAERWEMVKNVGTVVACIGGFIGYCFWSGLLQVQFGSDEKGEGEVKEPEKDNEEGKDKENEMELLEGFGSAEAILGLGGRGTFSPREEDEIDEVIDEEFGAGAGDDDASEEEGEK